MSKYYKALKLSENITRITCATQEMMYLVEGTDKAALIDTGTGYGHLDQYIKSLTDLPVIILNTHGHCDHAGGNYYFDEVHIHPSDIEIMKANIEMRYSYVELIRPDLYPTMTEDDFAPQKELRYLPIYDGDKIDLGGTVLEVLGAPGHTKGSVCFLDRKQKVLFSGDACNQRTFLFIDHSTSVVEYMDTLKKLVHLQPELEHIYNAHDEGEIPTECFSNVLDCCIDILNHKDDHIAFDFMNLRGYAAKKVVNEVERADGNYGNIIYDENKLY